MVNAKALHSMAEAALALWHYKLWIYGWIDKCIDNEHCFFV